MKQQKTGSTASIKKRLDIKTEFGLDLLCVDLLQATELVVAAGLKRERCLVITPNVDHVVTVMQRPEVFDVYRRARFLFADGMPLVWLGRLLPGPSIPARVTGADLIESIASACARANVSLALVGGEPGVAEMASHELMKRYPGLRIVGTYSPPFGFDHSKEESEKIVDLCRTWRPDILCLAFGAPKQEMWADKHLPVLECGPVLCFGAAIDFVAGKYKRAPLWVQNSGFEWFWRIFQDPVRMAKRYFLRDSVFFWYAAREISCRWYSYFLSETNKK